MSLSQIFIIWGDTDLIKMFTLFFEQHGYKTNSTNSFEDGFTTCLHKPPDILIVPRNLLKQDDGLEFCQRIRENSTLAHIPIIVGYADLLRLETDDAYQQAFDAGANACFGRVFDITDVLEEVKILVANPTTTGLVDRQTLYLRQRKAKAKSQRSTKK